MICSISVSFQFQSHFKKNFRVVGCTLENEHKQIRRYRGTLLLSGEKIELSRSFLFLNIGRIINNIISFFFFFFVKSAIRIILTMQFGFHHIQLD